MATSRSMSTDFGETLGPTSAKLGPTSGEVGQFRPIRLGPHVGKKCITSDKTWCDFQRTWADVVEHWPISAKFDRYQPYSAQRRPTLARVYPNSTKAGMTSAKLGSDFADVDHMWAALDQLQTDYVHMWTWLDQNRAGFDRGRGELHWKDSCATPCPSLGLVPSGSVGAYLAPDFSSVLVERDLCSADSVPVKRHRADQSAIRSWRGCLAFSLR